MPLVMMSIDAVEQDMLTDVRKMEHLLRTDARRVKDPFVKVRKPETMVYLAPDEMLLCWGISNN